MTSCPTTSRSPLSVASGAADQPKASALHLHLGQKTRQQDEDASPLLTLNLVSEASPARLMDGGCDGVKKKGWNDNRHRLCRVSPCGCRAPQGPAGLVLALFRGAEQVEHIVQQTPVLITSNPLAAQAASKGLKSLNFILYGESQQTQARCQSCECNER